MVVGGGRTSASTSRRQHAKRPAPFPSPTISATAHPIASAPPTSFAPGDRRAAGPIGPGWVAPPAPGTMQLSPKLKRPKLPPVPQPGAMPGAMPCSTLATRPTEPAPEMEGSLPDEWCVFAREFGFTYHEVHPHPLVRLGLGFALTRTPLAPNHLRSPFPVPFCLHRPRHHPISQTLTLTLT